MSDYWFSGNEAPCESGLNPNCPIQTTIQDRESGSLRLIGDIRDSAGVPFDGWLRLTNQDTTPTYGSSPRVVVSRKPGKIQIANGILDALIYPSDRTGSLVLFELGYDQSIPGSTPPATREIITDSFLARVPLISGVLEFNSLVPTGITHDRLDTAARTVAREIMNDPQLRSKVTPPLNIRGPFVPGSYSYGDLVTVPGNPIQTWLYQSQAPRVINTVPSAPVWLRLL
jgi:hypothetical protein